MTTLAERVDGLDWEALGEQLDTRGFAVTEAVLEAGEAQQLADMFDGGWFRSTIEMARHMFGDGRYRYFADPLPQPVAALRGAFYRRLAPVANHLAALLGGADDAFPLEH